VNAMTRRPRNGYPFAIVPRHRTPVIAPKVD
jgi:hypothetical protein